MYELRTLGTLDLRCDRGNSIPSVLAQPKRFALLVYLAVARPRGFHRRDTLLGMFWPEKDHEHARAALRNAVYFLRRSLAPEVLVNRGEGEISVDATLLRTDAGALEAALGTSDWGTALALYGGDFLKGFFLSACPEFDDWLERERDRLRLAAARAAWAAAMRDVEAGDLVLAQRSARKALSLAPTDEHALRSFLEALAAAGGRAGAADVYRRFATRLQEELGVEPSPETKALSDRILRSEAGITATTRPAGGTSAAEALGGVRSSVAVLPFISLSEERDMEFFGMGVMDDVLIRLSRVRGLRVVSRTSTMRYADGGTSVPEIAATLGVQAVLEGSVRRSGNRIRVVAQLIDGTTDGHLWGESYDREMEEIFHVQTEIAEAIAVALQGEISVEERDEVRRIPTDNLDAWDRYLRGVQAFQELEPSGLRAAETYLSQAVRLDPDFAHAWALYAQVRVLAGTCAAEPPRRYFPEIRDATARALALNPRCGEAHAAAGVVKLFHDWDPQAAEDEFSQATTLNPSDSLTMGWKAIFLMLGGSTEPALALARHAVVSDPLSAAANLVLGQILVMAGHLDEAIQVLESALRRWPDALQMHMWLGLAHVSSGSAAAALPHYDRAVQLSGGLPHFEALRATALASLGRGEEARTVLETLRERSSREYVDPYSFFSVTLVLDGFEAAAPHLEEMLEERSLFLPYLRGIPRFAALRAHPRFSAVMDRVWPTATVSPR